MAFAKKRLNPFTRNKFGAIRTVVNGISFPSKLEASVYCLLLKQFKTVHCQDSVKLANGAITWKCDFKVERDDGSFEWVEAKGKEDARFAVIKKLWKDHGPGSLTIYKGSASKPIIHKVIIPEFKAQVICPHCHLNIEQTADSL